MENAGETPESPMQSELQRLESKLETLLEHTRALRHANEILRRDLATARAENRDLSERTEQAAARIEALMNHLP